MSDEISEVELEAAAMALKALWESEENRASIAETGHGASYRYQAQVALEAANAVRGKTVVWHEPVLGGALQ